MKTLEEIMQEIEDGKLPESKEIADALMVYKDLYYSLLGRLGNAIKNNVTEASKESSMRNALEQGQYYLGAALELPPTVYIDKEGDLSAFVTKDGHKIHHK